MFKLENPHGNVQKNVRSEAKRDELLKEGWKPVEEALKGGDDESTLAHDSVQDETTTEGEDETTTEGEDETTAEGEDETTTEGEDETTTEGEDETTTEGKVDDKENKTKRRRSATAAEEE